MATRTNEPVIVRETGLERDDAEKAERLREDIAETRNHMARTVDAIEERLSPKNIKAQVSSVKEHLLGEVSSTKEKLLEEIKDVKSTVKTEVSDGFDAAKAKIRENTVGRVENMVHGARVSMTHAGSTTIDTVKTNPIPAALVAVGLGWLIVSSMKGKKASTIDSRIQARSFGPNAYGGEFGGVDEDGYAYSYDHDVAARNLEASTYGREDVGNAGGPRRVIKRGRRAVGNAVSNVGSTVSGVGHDVADKASNVAASARSAVSGVANTVADKAEHLAHDASTMAHDASNRVGSAARGVAVRGRRVVGQAGQKGRMVVRRAGVQARRAEQGFERELRENPIAFGAVAVAIGAAIGLLLPRTETEDRLIGAKKDLLLDTAKERVQGLAQQAISTVQEKAEGLSHTAGAVAKSAGGIADKIGGERADGVSHSNGLSNGLSNGVSNGLSKHV